MIGLGFGFVVLVMIGAGVLISRLAEIAKTDKSKKTWIWGILILIALIAVHSLQFLDSTSRLTPRPYPSSSCAA